ncbi:BioY protein [Kosmotoga pacifica]|uniref:Biotin transporter n=1 Tax=Kosmotoga pacifica TaxID=1330330 RepID=A0A0G2ZE29_9BACT|nr:BioY protein [Kosmotoga pacifica]
MSIAERYFELRKRIFEWPRTQPLLNKIALSIAMAALTAVFAQLKFYLPGTPVPITGQTFAVLISGVALGNWWGGIGQLIYVVLGIAGIPWFAGFSGGVNVLFGPTGGYLVGFIVASLFVGKLIDKYTKTRNFFPAVGVMLIANLIIYAFGLVQLWLWFSMTKGQPVSLIQLLQMGMLPFIPGDLFKIVLAGATVKALTPKE